MQIPYRKPGKYTHQRNDPHITKDKFDQLNRDLERLRRIRPQLAAEVSRLAELGDFSENAEYQHAKGKLRGVNNAILKLEVQIRDAVIIQPNSSGVVELGNTITVECNGVEKTYQILGSSETKPGQGIISHSSPLGSALMGCGVGDEVKLNLNNKEVVYIIKSIR